ncbi:hypothetical protein ACFVX9_30435 [Kitasatospora sp. NPDC058243]|uniref:hypothetical protein n=1 Tax=Kitasatospora sp. NPDC058243 TaxID=3346397 RepID=UPI0036DD997C
MGLWSKLTGGQPAESGQQRRAKAVRDADRAGHAAMNAKTRRSTALDNNPPPRAWWRNS